MKRLILFDIDETMIASSGTGRRAIGKALSMIFGISPKFDGIVLSGKTDPQICREVLLFYEVQATTIDEKLSEVFEIYPMLLEDEVAKSLDYRLHQGVLELIEALESHPSGHLGLLTGNIESGARIKLEPFKLNHHFKIGAYGSDSADRMNLPAIASSRAQEYFQQKFAAEDIVIIGDAINDIKCAQGFGAKSLAVNTGRTTREELEACKPDHLFTNLEDTKSVLEVIFS